MSFSNESSDSEWKATKIKTEKILKDNKKYYRQRFVERWIERFKPWLARDAEDPEKPFCNACRCRLNCNKCHLQRHERTTKHHSNLQAYLNANGLLPSNQNIGQRKERKKYTRKAQATEEAEADESKFESVFMDIDFMEGNRKERLDDSGTQETLHDFQFENEDDSQQNHDGTPHLYDMNALPTSTKKSEKHHSSSSKSAVKKDRKKLLLQIQKDKNELMSSFNELFTTATVEKKEKNHVDLFFESVSSSVKALSPKLIAETKMRVSQLICELELRAITENESHTSAASSTVLLTTAPLGGAYIINHQTPTNGSNQVGSSQSDQTYETTN